MAWPLAQVADLRSRAPLANAKGRRPQPVLLRPLCVDIHYKTLFKAPYPNHAKIEDQTVGYCNEPGTQVISRKLS